MHRRPYAAAVVLGVVSLFLWPPAPTRGQAPPRFDIQTVDGRDAVAGEALVKFRQQVPAADLPRLAPEIDADAAQPLGRTGLVRVRSRSLSASALVARLASRSDVAYVEPNYIVRAFAPPNDVSFSQLWGLDNVGQVVNGVPGVAGADIDALSAWDISVGSQTHVVAVVDTGIDYTHPDLAPNIWSAPAPFTVTIGGAPITCAAGTHGYNAIARSCNPMDDHDHGTHVAGTIGAVGNNGVGVVGVNWTASIMAIKFLDANGSGSIADAIDAIHFAVLVKQAFAATGGADIRVLSNSWGGSSFSQALLDEIHAADAQDMLFVAAAGNNGFDNDLLPTYPASYDAPNVVAVAATTNQDGRAWFSNYGASSVDLGAPGMDILSTTIGNTYTVASGTSMAAPHVSGAAALVLSRCALDTAALKDTLLGSVEPVPALESTTSTGGRLNVNSAIHACIAPPDTPASLTALGGNTRVTLSWSASLGAIGYSVKRSLTAGGPYTPIASAVRGVTYVDTAVVNGTTYYYVVSAENTLGESGDSSEASATPDIPPDLILSSFTVPATAGAGSAISVSVTTKNQGTGTAAPSTTRLYLSVNTIVEAGDIVLDAAQPVPELLGGASISTSLSITIPRDLTAGRYFVIAKADADDVLSEDLEANNALARLVQIGPDLTVSSFTVPATAAAGATISVTDTVKNQGGGDAAASSTSFHLSTDGTLGTGDVLLGDRAVPDLGPGATNAGSTTLTIPATTAVGAYFVLASADGDLAVPETLETNNSIARAVQIGGDLVVSTFLAPSTAGPGSTIAVSDTTKNQGAAATPESATRFYLSVNSSFDAADTALDGGRAVPELAPGALSSGPTSLTIPPTVAAGAYYLLAKADADNAVAETQENNNVFARSIQIGSDLVVPALTVPAKGEAGAPIAVSDTTTNQGAGAAAATTTRFYLSANSVLDAGDVPLGGRAVPALTPAASDSAPTTLTIPSETMAGAYYLIAKADADAIVVETQEGNNTAARAIQIGGDLLVTTFTAPAKGGAGASVTVSETTVNQGSVAVASTTTRFYLSPNALFDATDILLAGSRAIPELTAGGSSAGSTTVTIPASTATGTYFIFARADADNAVPETLETNNTASRTIQIGSDLAMLALTIPAKAAAGQPVVVSDTTTNQGGGDAPVSVTEFYLSVDAVLGPGDLPIGSRLVGDLAAGASSSGPTTVTIPAGAGPGTFYIVGKADADNTIVETVESNNTTARLIKIGPDLTVSIVTVSPSTVVAGALLTVTDAVANQGAEAAAPTTTRFYLSTNLTLDAGDTPLAGSRLVPQIDPNGAHSGPTAVTIPAGTPPGNYFLLAKADADGSVVESSETNNVGARAIKVNAAP